MKKKNKIYTRFFDTYNHYKIWKILHNHKILDSWYDLETGEARIIWK